LSAAQSGLKVEVPGRKYKNFNQSHSKGPDNRGRCAAIVVQTNECCHFCGGGGKQTKEQREIAINRETEVLNYFYSPSSQF